MIALLADQVFQWSYVGDHVPEIWDATRQHLEMTIVSVGVGFAISCVLAAIAIRFRIVYQPINAVAGVMYAVPSLALFVLLVPITGLTTLTAEIALVSYTIQILFRGIVAGIDGVPDSVRESATAMGYTRPKRLWRVEVPLALPVIMSALRIATVTTVGLVPIAGILGADQGGLGRFIYDGLQRFFNTPLLIGAVLTLALAVVLDLLLVAVERFLTPWIRKARVAS
jgi:osmoprotectant transport system permease protein